MANIGAKISFILEIFKFAKKSKFGLYFFNFVKTLNKKVIKYPLKFF